MAALRTADELQHRRRLARRTRIRRRLTACAVVGLAVAVTVAAITGRGVPDGATANTGAPQAAKVPAPSARVTITAVGDVMLGSPQFGLPGADGRGLLGPVRPLLRGDLVVGNLEGTLTDGGVAKCGARAANCYAFRSPPEYARTLAWAGFDVMNVANNHSYDFGARGAADTSRALAAARVRETGRPGGYVVLERRGVLVAVVGFSTYPWANRMTDLEGVRALVARAALDADVVVVTMHAGAEGNAAQQVAPGTETYLGENRGDVTAFARAAVDAGADLVVGHGPHVLRGMEVYRGRLVAYSMGNFVGWKAFALSGASGVSGVLQVTVRADGRFVRGRLRPVRLIEGGRPVPGGDAIRQVRALSRSDFGRRAVRITPGGTLRLP